MPKKVGATNYVDRRLFPNNPFPAIAAGKSGDPEVITAAGALSIQTENSDIQITQGVDQALTLEAGAEFQRKCIAMTGKSGAGNAVLTPAGGLINVGGAALTTITFNGDGDWITLRFINGKWNVETNSGCTLA
jgi:hypothetical protein